MLGEPGEEMDWGNRWRTLLTVCNKCSVVVTVTFVTLPSAFQLDRFLYQLFTVDSEKQCRAQRHQREPPDFLPS